MADETYNVTMTCSNCKKTFIAAFKKGDPVNLNIPCSFCGCIPGAGGVSEHSAGPAGQNGKKEILMEG